MAIIIRDPVEGVARLIEEQVTKNAVDINNLKVSDSVLASRISSLEAGANLGGANLVRFAFTTDNNDYYRLMDDLELVTLPATWQSGDYIEVHSRFKNDIPAYGYIDGTMIVLDYMGDFVIQYGVLKATNITRGTYKQLSIPRYETFAGSMLVDINANNAKSQIVTVLNDMSRNLSTQYVSFDLNDDGIWNWVYIGPIGTDGKDGFSINPFSTLTQYNLILANAKAGDTLLDGAGVVFNKGDLKTILALQPTVVFRDTGNILGPQGEQGEQGLVGPTTLMSIQAITGVTDVAQDSIVTIQDTQLNREAKLGEYLTFIYINTATSNSFMVNAIVTTVGSTSITATVLQATMITGVRGPQGTAGPAGQSLNIQEGIYIPTTVPVFNTTAEGDAFIVIDTSGSLNTYMLYIHGAGGTEYTVVDNWNGVSGPAPVLTFTSTSTGSGGTSYATVTQTGPGAYTVNLFLASGLNASSVLDNSVGTSITRGYTQAAINQLLQAGNLIINPDFAINQRGESSYTGGASTVYTVDRWSIFGSGLTLTVNANGSITLTNTSTTTRYLNYRGFEQSEINKLLSKQVTLSCRYKLESGNACHMWLEASSSTGITTPLSSTTETEKSVTGTMIANSSIMRMSFSIAANSSITLYWAKLELGSIATPFVPPLIAEELPRCQRYYQKIIRLGGILIFGFGALRETTNLRTAIPISVPLRTTPTVAVSGLKVLNFATGIFYTTDGATTVLCAATNQIYLQMLHSISMGTAGDFMQLYADTINDYISFDAEL